MTVPTVYRSDDASAPVLSGAAGSLITVLDAILVNGYGSKAAAGWTKEYSSGGTVAAYRMGAGGTAERMYLRVDDNAAQSAILNGYVSMSAISTGVEPFPSLTQVASLFFYKSSSANSTARPWIAFATPTCFYLMCEGDQTLIGFTSTSGANGGVFFGEFNYYGAGFTHNVALIGAVSALTFAGKLFNKYPLNGSLSGHYVARTPLNLQTPVACMKTHLCYTTNNTYTDGNPIGTYNAIDIPDRISGKVLFSKVEVILPGYGLFGSLPGLYAPIIESRLPHLAVLPGSGDLSGKQVMIVHGYSGGSPSQSGGLPAQLAFDMTDWG